MLLPKLLDTCMLLMHSSFLFLVDFGSQSKEASCYKGEYEQTGFMKFRIQRVEI